MKVEFYVPGIPRPQGSKKAIVRGNRAMLIEQSPYVKDWRQDIRAVAMEHEPVATDRLTPVHVSLVFYLVRPAGHFNKSGLSAAGRRKPYPTSTPDGDKLERAVLDALTSVCFVDDSQVVSLDRLEVWRERPGLDVTVQTMGDELA